MNRKLSENNLKINALKRSQMMKSLEFQKLVTRVDRFFFDHKLYDLMKKKRSRKVNTNDHQFDFYSILLELLYEVHRNDSSEQARLFERVLEWYQVNQVKLEFPKNVVPTHVSATQSSECSEESKISKKPSPSVRPTNRKNIIGKINRMQLLDQKCTDEDGICSSVTTVKSTPSKAITTSEFVTLTDFSESRNVTEQHTPTEQHQKESFQPLIERSFHAQIPSQKKALQDSFFTKKGSPNLSDVINTITTPNKMAARKRAQSVPVHLFRNVSMDGKVNSPQAGTPRSAKGNIYHDWRGLISPESSGHVVEFQRTLLQNMVLRNRRRTLVPQSNVKKALGSLLTRGDHKVIRFQDVEAIDESGTSAWRNAAMENTQSKSLQRSQPEQIDQSTSNLSRFFCHNCQVKLQHRINCVLCLERYCKMQGVYSANLPDLRINQSQDANMVLNQQQFDSIRAQGNVAEKADQSLCNCKKIKITSNELSDQSEDVSVANRQHISTTESSFDKLEMNKTLDFGTELQEHDGTFILTSRSKGEHHKEMKRDALYTSPLVDENIFQASQTIEEFVDTIPKTSADEDFLPLIAKTGHLLVKLGEDQQVHLTVLKPIDFQKYSRSTFDYQQTMQAFHLSIIGHHIGRQGLLEGKAEEYSKLQKVIKKPADIQMEPTKAGRPIGLHFQPKHRAKVEKAIERQKSVNSAVDIHDIITQYINKEYELDAESIQNEKIQKKLKEHGELKRRHKEFTEKIKTIYRKPLDVEIKARNKILLKKRHQHEINKKVQVVKYQRVLTKFNAERSRRLEESTPHLELIEASYPQLIGPSPYRQKKAAVFIQKFMRGWLVRKTHIRIKNKASGHGKSLKTAVKKYRLMMNRIRRRFDAHWEAIPFVYPEFEEWLDRKKKYENMFAKREFWKEINRSDLPNFFKDCDHYPSQREINDTLLLINSGLYNNLPETLNKKQVVELAFTIYPPSGAGLGDRSIYRSTWVRPVVDGEEGFKYILSEHPVLKEAKIKVVGRLVARSISERNAIRRAARNVTEDYFLEDTCLDKITSGR